MLLVRASVARSDVEPESGASHSFFLAVLEVAEKCKTLRKTRTLWTGNTFS